MKRSKDLEKICQYATERTDKFQMTKTCYDCKLKEQIVCFEPYKFKNCYYFDKKKEKVQFDSIYLDG